MRRHLYMVWGFITLFVTGSAVGQGVASDGHLAGRVLSSESEAPLEGATVEIRLASDSSLVTGVITDHAGRFSIEGLPNGEYVVRVGFVGYSTEVIPGITLSETTPRRDLGDLELVQNTLLLDDVVVSSERAHMVARIDRTVYNVADHPVTAGGSAREVLRELPSIEINIEGAISYRGNSNVAIHINGRPSALTGDALMSFLLSLPADAIERVEMIPVPSARYEPDGMAGIINIVLAENREAGWSGGVSTGIETSASYHLSPHLGYQTAQWTFFANYGLRRNAHIFANEQYREHYVPDPYELLETSRRENHVHMSHSMTTQVDYRLAPGTTLGLSTIFGSGFDEFESESSVSRGQVNADLSHFSHLATQENTPRRLDTRLAVYHSFNDDEEHVLNAQLRFLRYSQDRAVTYHYHHVSTGYPLGDLFREDYDELVRQTQHKVIEVDYDRPLGLAEIEAGYQGSLRRVESDRRLTSLQDDVDGDGVEYSNIFAHDEQVHAAYGNLSFHYGLIGLKAGVRVEQALTSSTQATLQEEYSNNYRNIFPSAFLTYQVNDGRLVQLSYSKRIRRPSMWFLNPLDTSTDPSFRRIGNPHLQPAFTHSFELGITQHWSALTLRATPFFRRIINQIGPNVHIDEEGVSVLTYDNFASSNSYGVELVTTLRTGPLRGNISFNAHHVVTDADNVDAALSSAGVAMNTRANLAVTLRPGLAVQWTQFYRAPMSLAGGRVASYMRSNLALRQEILGGQGSLSLRADDLFDTVRIHRWRTMETFYEETQNTGSGRQLMVTFQYTFGAHERRQRQHEPEFEQ